MVAFSSNCAHLCSGIQLEEWLPLGNGDIEVSFTWMYICHKIHQNIHLWLVHFTVSKLHSKKFFLTLHMLILKFWNNQI